MSKFYIIAGEASGDLHGSNLIKQILGRSPQSEVIGWGGDLLRDAGCKVTIDYKKGNFMGFWEVIKNLGTISSLFKKTKREILDFKPDGLILVDYPGFNLRMAKWAFEFHIPVYYYISPQVWAWKSSRVHAMKKYIRKLFCILPFEPAFFEQYGMQVEFVGHPLIEHIKSFKTDPHWDTKNKLKDQKILALLPGSRKQEIETHLPIYLKAAEKFPEYQIVIAGMKSHESLYYKIVDQASSSKDVVVLFNKTYDLLSRTELAIVTSGTAGLETALFKVPAVICYKGNNLSYHIAKRLVKVKYISLANLILDRPAVKELIQHDCNADRIASELINLQKEECSEQLKNDYLDLEQELGKYSTSEITAIKILSDIHALKEKNELEKNF